MNATDQLRAAANQLRQSERGQRVLTKIVELHEAGATGLDRNNQVALTELIGSMLTNPWDWPAELHSEKEASK